MHLLGYTFANNACEKSLQLIIKTDDYTSIFGALRAALIRLQLQPVADFKPCFQD